MRFVRKQMGYLLFGFVFWLPVGIAAIVGHYIFGSFESLGGVFLGWFLPQQFVYPGLGIVLSIVVFFLTGLILRETPLGNLLSGVPFLGMFFRRSGETITFDKLLNLTPCLFLYSPTCPSYGWILSEQAVKLGDEEAHFTLTNVYYPNVPTLITGQVYSVRKETVIKLGNESREIIDVLLYGLRRPQHIRYLPWEDEAEEEFKQRARSFGINLSI